MGARGLAVRDVGIAGAGIVFGWLMSKTWDDPGCRLGLAIFLVVTAALVLTFALAVVGHGRKDVPPAADDGDEEPDERTPR